MEKETIGINSHAKAAVLTRSVCRLCGSDHIQTVFKLAPTPIADRIVPKEKRNEPQEKYPLDLAFCNECRHVQLVHALDPKILFKDYTYVTSSSWELVEHFRLYTKSLIERFSPAKNSLVVEIGSNDGSLLKFFKDRGLRVVGVDPALEIAKDATARGLLTIPTFFTLSVAKDIRKEHGSAAIICANNVFAHADNLGEIAEGISSLLAQDGVFVFEVSYLVHIIERFLFDTIYHEHVCYHTVKPLISFFLKHNMQLFDVEFIPTKGGSIRCFVQHKNGPHQVSEDVARLVREEEEKGYDKPEMYIQFGKKLEEIKQELQALLKKCKDERSHIGGYGASPTVTTLMYHFELGPEIIDFIVDDNPSKQNSYSPGYHIPIVSKSVLYQKMPEYVLILAWQYAKTIIQNNQEYLNRGMAFIIPLPHPRVITKDSPKFVNGENI